MGIFDGVLICTDIDGTLTHDGKVPEENLRYIEYFMANGGLFTVSTGRYAQFIVENNFGFVPNTYTVVVNGTVISSLDEKEIIYDVKLPRDFAAEIVDYAKSEWNGFRYRACDILHQENILDAPVEYDANKLVFITEDEPTALEMLCKLQHRYDGLIHVSRSWATGVEVIAYGSGKGACVKKLKELTNSKLLICVGDFENDIDMIKAADIGYAVANATDDVKSIADRITVSNDKAAIAAIIKMTESELRKSGNETV